MIIALVGCCCSLRRPGFDAALKTGQMSCVGTGLMSAAETEQISAAETKQMFAVPESSGFAWACGPFEVAPAGV